MYAVHTTGDKLEQQLSCINYLCGEGGGGSGHFPPPLKEPRRGGDLVHAPYVLYNVVVVCFVCFAGDLSVV